MSKKDLIVLAADKDMEHALTGLLTRPVALGIRSIEAFRAALREAQTPRSASLYEQIAKKVSLDKCSDTVFQEFKSVLQSWFSEG